MWKPSAEAANLPCPRFSHYEAGEKISRSYGLSLPENGGMNKNLPVSQIIFKNVDRARQVYHFIYGVSKRVLGS